MLRRLKGHRDVILEAGGENYYPAKSAAPISTLLLLIDTQALTRSIRRQAHRTTLTGHAVNTSLYGYKLHPEVCPTGQLKLFKFAPGKFVSFFIPEKYIPLQSARNAYHLVHYRAAKSIIRGHECHSPASDDHCRCVSSFRTRR